MTAKNLAFELFNEIGIIDQLAGAVLERALPKGMTRAQFTVLNHFVRLGHQDRSPAQLASAFQVTRPTMTSTLSRMDRAGLISIRADPSDGRAKLVSLTDKGRAMRETCLDAIAGRLPEAVAVIGEAKLRPLIETLRTLRIALDEARNL